MISELKQMDCMEYMRQFPDNFFDLACVDPPYFKGLGKMGYFGKKQSSLKVKRGEYSIPAWDSNIPTVEYRDELIRVSKQQIIFGINYYDWTHCPGRIVWDKVNGGGPFSDAEIASCSIHDSVRMYRFMWNGMNQGSKSDGVKMEGNKKLNEPRLHPTQKPIQLYRWIFKTYAKPGFKILDTHLGSGSSRIAAHDMKCDFWSCEIDPEHVAKAEKRFRQYAAAPMFL